MKRDIITIDEEKCNGCGECVPGCPEGALQIIDGKAKLAAEIFCDGLGACIKKCPRDAIKIEQKEAEEYNEYLTIENISKHGDAAVKEHLKHLQEHNQQEYLDQALEYLEQKSLFIPDYGKKTQCNCPSSMYKTIDSEATTDNTANTAVIGRPQLKNWPIQLSLMNPDASYFENADLLISADCAPFSYPNFQERFLKDKILIMFCPKLDKNIDEYVQKLTHIFATKNIQSISIVHMEVPCCSGVEIIVKRALENAKKLITVKDYTISISGEIV